MKQVSRDPFVRHDVIRRNVQVYGSHTCANCGQVRGRRNKYLYQYGIWHDGGRMGWADKLFCSIDCKRSYYGG